MASVTGFTAERMKEIEDSTVVGGHVNESGDLILNRRDGGFIVGGHVAGQPGPPGTVDPVIIDGINDRIDDNTEQIANSKIQALPPTNLLVMQNSAAFLDDGRIYTQLYFAWDSVIEDVTLKPVTIAEYEIWARRSDALLPAPVKRSPGNEMVIEGWVPNIKQHVSVRARAVGSSVWSERSAEIEVIPVYPPANVSVVPSAPIVHSAMKLYYVDWDGKFVGGVRPPGFQKIVAEFSVVSETGPWLSLPGTTTEEGNLATMVATIGIPIWVRFYWLDTVGRKSLPSAVGTGIGKGFVLPDISGPVRDAITEAENTAQEALDSLTTVVKSVLTEYSVNSSETVPPTTGWSTATPERTPGTFIWSRTTTTYADDTTSTSNPVLLTGNTGPTGAAATQRYTWIRYADTPTSGMSDTPDGKIYMGIAHNKTTATESSVYADYQWSLIKGEDGIPGQPGADGQTTYTWIKYADDAAGAGMSNSPTGKTHIGIAYNKPTATESTTPSDYEWALIQGAQGVPGNPGNGILNSVTTYQVGTSGTTAPTGTWLSTIPATAPGQFLWVRTVVTYTNATTSTVYSVSAHGATGSAGSAGIGVSSITPYFILVGDGSPAPAKPTTNPPGGSWSLTEPAYTASTELYRTELVLYSNSSFAYTNVTKVSSYTAATQAVTVANLADAAAKGMVKASQVDPGHQVGRIWIVTNASGQMIGIKISNGTVWTSYLIVADQILVPSSVGNVSIANGAVTARKMSVGDMSNLVTINESIPATVAYGDWIHGIVNGWSRREPVTSNQYFMFRDQRGPLPFKTGDRIRIRFEAYIEGTISPGGMVPVIWTYGPANVTQQFPDPFVLTNTPQTITREVTITGDVSNKLSYLIGLSGTGVPNNDIRVRNVEAYVMNAGVLIEDGTVTANKVMMDQGFADKFWANEGNFGKISVNMVEPSFGSNLDISSSGSITLIVGQIAQQQATTTDQQSQLNQVVTNVTDLTTAVGNAQATGNASGAAAAAAKAAADAANAELNTLGQYIKILPTGMNFSTPDSPISLNISNANIAFNENGVPTTWWDSGQMIAPKFVGSEFTLDNHKFEAYGPDTIIRRL